MTWFGDALVLDRTGPWEGRRSGCKCDCCGRQIFSSSSELLSCFVAPMDLETDKLLAGWHQETQGSEFQPVNDLWCKNLEVNREAEGRHEQ